MVDTSRLKTHILASLVALPNSRELCLTVLQSTPKRIHDLFPHTTRPPRCFQTDFLVVLGYGTPSRVGDSKTTDGLVDLGATRAVGQQGSPESAVDPAASSQILPKPGEGLVMTSAISAHLYTLPNTSSSILYVSKLDSSSYAPRSLPLTNTLITSFISFFLLPDSRPTPEVKVQLFARSQGQYLFPNSEAGKGALSGGKLCGWWKGVYERVVRDVLEPTNVSAIDGIKGAGAMAPPTAGNGGSIEQPISSPLLKFPAETDPSVKHQDTHLAYFLPSYTAPEAAGLMGLPKHPLPPGVQWNYEPPYRPDSSKHLASSGSSGLDIGAHRAPNLADLIPSLDDDPKYRFLEEIASDVNREVTEREQARPDTYEAIPNGTDGTIHSDSSQPLVGVHAGSTANDSHGHGPPRLQAGPSSPPKRKIPAARAMAAQADEHHRRQAYSALSKISFEEFWERMGFRGECAADVTGFFSLSVTPSRTAGTMATAENHSTQAGPSNTPVHVPPVEPEPCSEDHLKASKNSNHNGIPRTSSIASTASSTTALDPVAKIGQLPPTIVDRCLKALLNTDFADIASAVEGSEHWLQGVETIVNDEIGREGWDMCYGAVSAKHGVQAGTKVGKRKEEVVTMLQPRKKKRA